MFRPGLQAFIHPSWIVLVLLAFSDQTCCGDEDPLKPPAVRVEHVPVVPGELKEKLVQYQNIRSALFQSWGPANGDGSYSMLVATRFGNTRQLHRVDGPRLDRTQVTFFNEPVLGRYLPQLVEGKPSVSRTMLVVLSEGGNERDQIYRVDESTGKSVLLTDKTHRNILGPVSRDGKRMIVRHDSTDKNIYLASTERPLEQKLLFPSKDDSWMVLDWSKDEQFLLLLKYVSINESYPALLDLRAGKLIHLRDGGEKCSFPAMAFSPDGLSILAACDDSEEFPQLCRIDRETRKLSWIGEREEWGVESIVVDQENSRVAFTRNVAGSNKLFLLEGDQVLPIDLPEGVIDNLAFSPDGGALGMTISPPNAPAETYSLSLGNAHKLTRWTYSETGGIPADRFQSAQMVEFPSFDGRKISAWSMKPRVEGRFPVLISIHGGPEGQSRPVFNATEQFYANELGIAVLRPNVRGSSGFGKTFLKIDNGMLREDSVKDIGALLDWIKTQPDLDPDRVAVIGGSYGGYMVLASLVHYSDRLRAGVDIVGIANFNTFLKNTSVSRRDLRRAEYGDERVPEMQAFFEKINPASNASKITARLMVAHGVNDPRVPFSEAEQIVAKVRGEGREVWTVYADNEGHGFSKKDNSDYLSAAIILFLQKAILVSEPAR